MFVTDEDDEQTDRDTDIKDFLLISPQTEQANQTNESSSQETTFKKVRLRLLLTKGSVFVIGFIVLMIGAVLAGVLLHSTSNITDCSADKLENSTCSGHCTEGSMLATLMPEPTRSFKFSAASITYLF